jgi:hypothetical protein
MKLVNTLSLFLFFNILCYSQTTFKNEYSSKIVFFNDLKLKEVLKEIIIKKKTCENDGNYWYVDFMKNDLIMITQDRIENLVLSKGINNIYTTFIDDKIVFIISDKNSFKQIGLSVDLKPFVNKPSLSIEEFSFWVIQKKHKNEYQIVKEKIYKCDN